MKLHLVKGYIQNIFLVEYPHGCMLLDGASRADVPNILSFLEDDLNRPVTDLKVVMITHMHPDHAGGAELLKQKTGCITITGRSRGHWYSGISGFFSHIIDLSLALWVAGRIGQKRTNLWFNRKLKTDMLLEDGQSVPEFDEWYIRSTPGHTDRDISLVNSSQQLIYVADLVVQVKGQLTSPFPVHYPVKYRESLAKLYEYTGFQMLMAHVPSFTLEKEHVDDLIKRAPDTPRNNKNAMKNKLRRLLFLSER